MPHRVRDRFSYICAAGKKVEPNSLTNELKNYRPDEAAEYLIKNDKFQKAQQTVIEAGVQTKIPPKSNTDTAQTLIEANLNKFRFKEFEENFYEDLYYHSAKAGRTGKPARIGSKPDDVTNLSRTFGKIIESNGSAYDIICPRKTPGEVLKEQLIFHDKYILSHNSYLPSEQLKRYPKEIFDPTGKTFGRWNNIDISGKQVKYSMYDCSKNDTVILNTIHEDVSKKKDYQLGKALQKQDFNHPEGLRYGSNVVKDKYTLNCLIQNSPPCPKLIEFLEAVSYLSNLRIKLKNKSGFNLTALDITLRSIDTNNSQFLDWKVVFQVLAGYFLHLDQVKIKIVSNHFKITNNEGKVNFVEFLKFLDCGIPLPSLGKLTNIQPTDPKLCTTYREFATDREHDEYCEFVPTAGVLDKTKPVIPKSNGCRAHLECLCDETDVGACISPSIPFQYGLSHRDYLLPRNKEEIRMIFHKLLKNISESDFDKLYDEALNLHTSVGNMASVEAFKCCLVKYRRTQAIKVFTI